MKNESNKAFFVFLHPSAWIGSFRKQEARVEIFLWPDHRHGSLGSLGSLGSPEPRAGASGGAATNRAPERNDPWRFPGRNPEVLSHLAGHPTSVVGQHLGTPQNGLVMFSSYLKK